MGICRLFKKIDNLLKDGGHFIFESHEWRSYNKKSTMTELFKYNKKRIQIKPKNFKNFLV
jgi:hypothetical protein